MDSSKKGGGIWMLILSLGLITFVCALALSFTNQITKPLIEKNAAQTRATAMEELIADATFEIIELSEADTTEAHNNVQLESIYRAVIDGVPIGYCVEVSAGGFGGDLSLMVGILADGTVAGSQVISHAETPGLGAKAKTDAEWIIQFRGKQADGALAVTKDGGTINAISGATITSRAVTDGINAAAYYAYLVETGGIGA